VPVVPVAHNAGRLWPRNAFRKRAGTVTVRIGPPIETAGRTPKQVIAQVKAWIEAQQETL
jgi:1-acyl-sn-glycerol-3-phosphate acyltransferase